MKLIGKYIIILKNAVNYKKDNILIEKTETNYESTLTRLMLINYNIKTIKKSLNSNL